MSDAAVANIVTGCVTIVGMLVGFLTMWVKLQHASSKAEEAVSKAEVVERKLDANTATTEAVDTKADTIVEQTDGTLTRMRQLVENMVERVSKLEDYNRDSSHRLFDAVNTLALKVERLLVTNEGKTYTKAPPQAGGST